MKEKCYLFFRDKALSTAGMGSDLYKEYAVAKKVYTQASDVLGYDIAELSFNDPRRAAQSDAIYTTGPAYPFHCVPGGLQRANR